MDFSVAIEFIRGIIQYDGRCVMLEALT